LTLVLEQTAVCFYWKHGKSEFNVTQVKSVQYLAILTISWNTE